MLLKLLFNLYLLTLLASNIIRLQPKSKLFLTNCSLYIFSSTRQLTGKGLFEYIDHLFSAVG